MAGPTITQLPGALDGLIRGLQTGFKISSDLAKLKQTEMETQLLEKKVESADDILALEKGLIEEKRLAAESTRNFNTNNLELQKNLQAQRMEESRTRQGESKAKTSESHLSARTQLIQSIAGGQVDTDNEFLPGPGKIKNPGFGVVSLKEAMDYTEPYLGQLAKLAFQDSPYVAGEGEHLQIARQLQSEHMQIKSKQEIAENRNLTAQLSQAVRELLGMGSLEDAQKRTFIAGEALELQRDKAQNSEVNKTLITQISQDTASISEIEEMLQFGTRLPDDVKQEIDARLKRVKDRIKSNRAKLRKNRKAEQPNIPTISTQKDFDALPKGAEFIDAGDGLRKRK